MCELNGKVYGVTQGLNTQALSYNKEDFRKAGLPVPWHPKNWAEIMAAALKIKEKVPGVTPMWAMGGTGVGAGIELGVSELMATSSEPAVYNTATKKWVGESKGLQQTFEFIHLVAKWQRTYIAP
jgi:multiple sugar transport system substrate-binding protein